MSSERWERTKQILEEALRYEPERRNSYLDGACGAVMTQRATQNPPRTPSQARK